MANAVPLSTWDADDETNDGLGVADENQAPSTVNDGMRKMMGPTRLFFETLEFRDFGDVPTRTSNTVFTVPGDQTLIYQIGRRLKAIDVSDLFGTITNSVFTTLTTVTVSLDSGNLSVSLTAVELGMAVDQQSIGVGAFSSFTVAPVGLSQPINLVIENNSSNVAFQMDVNADQIDLDNGSIFFRAQSVNLTLDITASGVNGLDTGSEAADTFYFIWAIVNGTAISSNITDSTTANKLEDSTADFVTDGVKVGDLIRNTTDTTETHVTAVDDLNTLSVADDIFVSGENYEVFAFASLLSLSSTNPTLPSGFTFKRFVGVVKNDSGSDFLETIQFGEDVLYKELQQESLSAPTIAFQSQSLAAFVPPISRQAHLNCLYQIDDSVVGSLHVLSLSATPGSTLGVPVVYVQANVANVDIIGNGGGLIALDASQSIDFDTNNVPTGTNAAVINILGYKIPI